ncbi:uncharacterized protein Dana_GF27474 [Drosophila ananassae]|uniref:Uncharacterized protein n=2 Tax=Drosophila ananassae TaxID=7217 RepID=A0A0P8XWY5_DROAN|nr:uncharacterized protein Dana_GF27474 [Drosophila ananassae]
MDPLISYCAKLGSGSGSYTICTCASLGRVRVCLANRFEFAAKWFAECNMLCRFTPNVPATQLIRRCGFLALWSGATTNISICSRAADHPPSTKATTRATSSFYASAAVNAATTDIFALSNAKTPPLHSPPTRISNPPAPHSHLDCALQPTPASFYHQFANGCGTATQPTHLSSCQLWSPPTVLDQNKWPNIFKLAGER